MIKGESKNRGNWKIGKVSQLYTWKDEVVRAVQMQVGTTFLVRPIQLLYRLELHCDVPAREMKDQEETNLNAECKGIPAKTQCSGNNRCTNPRH